MSDWHPWTLETALPVIRIINDLARSAGGCHVALTGGLLYASGKRKDMDLVFYAPKEGAAIDRPALFAAMEERGFLIINDYGRIVKAAYGNMAVDMFFPEHGGSTKDYVASADVLGDW